MTLAAELGARGVEVLVVDTNLHTTTNPRCNTTNARSMEYFRRIGIADTIRRAGLPLDHASDIVYVTSIDGDELARFRFSSSGEILEGTAHEFVDWPTPEPQHRISQIFLEPILFDHLRGLRSVTVHRGWQATSITQGEASAHVVLTGPDGSTTAVRADFVVGCDGGASLARRSIGARLEGDATAAEERLSIYFRSAEMKGLLGERPGWSYWWYGPQLRGSFMQLNGQDLFLCHARVPDGMPPEDLDPDEVMLAAIGRPIDHEKLDVIRWTPRRLVANRFHDRRIVLAGDAAHLWLPLGGFGMNTGIADAVGLAWRLAAIIGGWGGNRLLDDYQRERQAIGEATSRAAVKIDQDMKAIGRDPELHQPTARGARLRSRAGELIMELDRQQWYSQGVQFGSRYLSSPGIATGDEPDAAAPAISRIDEYAPTCEPGARFPHQWLPGHRSIFDSLGFGFSLVCVGTEPYEAHRLVAAFAGFGAPLTVLPVERTADSPYDRRFVLVRPDLFIAWSGDQVPDDGELMISRLLGLDHVLHDA